MRFVLFLILVSILIAGCGYRSPGNMLLFYHNEERQANELKQFESDILLENYAQKHAEWMAQNQSMKHSRLGSAGIFPSMAENIAMGQKTEEEVTNAWMKSRGHRLNILNPTYQYAGFGHAISDDGTNYWCAVFGG